MFKKELPMTTYALITVAGLPHDRHVMRNLYWRNPRKVSRLEMKCLEQPECK